MPLYKRVYPMMSRLERYRCLDMRIVCSQGLLPGGRLLCLSSQSQLTLAAHIITSSELRRGVVLCVIQELCVVALTLCFARVREFRLPRLLSALTIEHITTTRIHALGHPIRRHTWISFSIIYNRASNNISPFG
jgi:hypothetical protein